jgi:hypothetical protein
MKTEKNNMGFEVSFNEKAVRELGIQNNYNLYPQSYKEKGPFVTISPKQVLETPVSTAPPAVSMIYEKVPALIEMVLEKQNPRFKFKAELLDISHIVGLRRMTAPIVKATIIEEIIPSIGEVYLFDDSGRDLILDHQIHALTAAPFIFGRTSEDILTLVVNKQEKDEQEVIQHYFDIIPNILGCGELSTPKRKGSAPFFQLRPNYTLFPNPDKESLIQLLKSHFPNCDVKIL